MIFHHRIWKLNPAMLILLSFLLVIFLGTVMLKIPASTTAHGISWIDALFTSTSAVCVTGLIVVDTGTCFTGFGQCVILMLIQVGGLGIMTISVALFHWLGRKISFHQRRAMQDLFSSRPREDIFNLVKSIILMTLGVEFLGAVFLTIHWNQEFGFAKAVFQAVFHSVSAFCNAGFALFPDSMMKYSDSYFLNTVICSLIIIGGIGFPVLYDLQCWFRQHKIKRFRFSVQTKTVLLTTLVLILAGALFIYIIERQGFMEDKPFSFRLLTSIFQSITCRTAGFNTVDIGSLKEATLIIMLFLMFFGASPGSCGGGVKTTTLALLVGFTLTGIRRKARVNIFKKSIPAETVDRSITLVLVSIGIIGLIIFLLLMGDSITGHEIHQSRDSFLLYLFETVSAFGTVGLSMGVTQDLSMWGKILIIIMMIIGRVGVLTFSYIIVGSGPTNGIERSEENIMIG
ncbi:MAG: ATPase [Desulfobacterales bacterium RIFOXYA12_FULL_46_15]|nr:MAG: ATPase [Desulfobacterales bacterium RIFOXYA12_FULL_46_15]